MFNWLTVPSFVSRRTFVLMLVVIGALMMVSATAFAQTPVPPPSIDIDITPLFDSMNSYIPLFLVIFAIPGGIVIAIAIVRMIITLIQRAFSGAGVK
jgi:hypothetical protein